MGNYAENEKADPNFLYCLKCNCKLASNEDLFLYRPVSTESHLAVKYEKTESILNRSNMPFKVFPISPPSAYKTFGIKCAACGEIVGSLIKCGPNQEALLCISLKSTYNVLQDGTKLTNASSGGPHRRKQQLQPSGMEIRNVAEFYGPDFKAQKSQALLRPLLHPTINDLNGLDLSSLIKDKPRSYQIECFCTAALFSSIVQIPTGSGKTLISVMLAALYKQLNPDRMVWFLTDRVPLVFQQARYIEEQTSLTVIPLAGEIQTSLKPTQLIKYDVLVCTVQTLINMIINGQLRPEDASMVVFDEVHHAVKNHPYVVFIETFLSKLKAEDRPRLLGLTASPAAGNPIQMKLQLSELKSLCRAQFYTPCIYREDLESAVNRPDTNFIAIDLDLAENDLSKHLFDAIRDFFRGEKLPCTSFDEIRSSLRCFSERPELSSVTHRIHQYITAIEMTSILGSKYSSNYLMEMLSDSSRNNCELSPRESEILNVCKKCPQLVSPKALALCKLIESNDLNENPDIRMIVFVETKRTARWLASFLQENLSNGWNPTAFIGQSSNSVDGMTWNDQQRPLLALFRSGHIKLLVATSVLQEGLDVAACSRIVLFDRTWSLKAFLQSRGRARAHNSQYTIICSPEDEAFYRDLANQESILNKMILDEIVETNLLCLELVMAMVHLNVKYKSIDFGRFKLEIAENYHHDYDTLDRSVIDAIDDSECSLSLIVHLAHENIRNSEANLSFRVSSIERRLDHLFFFNGLYEHFIDLEISNILLKDSNKSWISLVENIFDPLLKSRFENGLLELDSNFVKNVILDKYESGPLQMLGNCLLQMQMFSVGYFECSNILIECASQHHSFTPNLSVVKFEPFSRSFNILFQESPDSTFRIEIRFECVDSFCILSPTFSDAEDSNFSLSFPLKCPPLLYKSSDLISQFDIESSLDKFNWNRLPADSFSSRLSDVFALCPVIKLDLLLNASSSKKLFQALLNLDVCIFYSPGLNVQSFPEYHSMWSFKVESVSKALNFEAQYRLKSFISETWSSTSCKLPLEWLQPISKSTDFKIKQLINDFKNLKFIDFNEYFESFFTAASEEITQKSENLDFIKSVTWTPSRLIFHAPTAMISNRVLREFGYQNFIKVQFRDEDLSKLSMVPLGNTSIDKLLDIGLKRVLEEGIRIGDRRFQFLAMSSSQLRNHGCWFVDEGLGVQKVREWLGSFDSIKNVAKYVARLGQSFSSSLPTLSVPSFDFIPDWEANGFCFSDGCGMISTELASQITQILDLKSIPSAFQIRFAGFKGVVALNPQCSSHLSLRPSMKKYESSLRILDVLNVSQAFPCHLNRQIIMILSALGISDSVFEKLQFEHLKSLHEMFHTNSNLNLEKFDMSNLPLQDPFVKLLKSASFQQQMNDLLFKSKIFIPKGRILMGVVDESGTLEEDEVFCQIDDLNLSSVIEGSVVLAKNPCMHPGDVRVLKAVKNPLLESYSRNVIVFSRRGSRPIPNMCSGSDLDGDLYFVSWDQNLIPPAVDEPMNYEGLPALNNSTPITDKDLRGFMLFFIKNDQLGSIANAHVAFADQLQEGVRDPACKALSKLFSLAVDFPKTGFVGRLPKEIRIEKYPDFMMKTDRPAYTSQRILGKLFREVRIISANLNFGSNNDIKNSLDFNLLRSGYEAFTHLARRMYERYAAEVAKILIQYGLKKESHLLVKCSAEISDSEIMEPAKLAYYHLIDLFRREFDSITEGESQTIVALADACYYVVYSDAIKPKELLEPVLSFPWIFETKTNSLNTKMELTNADLSTTVGKSLESWFEKETEGLMDYLSTKLDLINQIVATISDDGSNLKLFCIQEYFLTRKLVLRHKWAVEDEINLLKHFPDAKVIKREDSTWIHLNDLTIIFSSTCDDFSQMFSSRESYLLNYFARKLNEPGIARFSFDKVKGESFDALIELNQVSEWMRSWSRWNQNSEDPVVFKSVSEAIIKRLSELIESDCENRPKLMKIYFTILKNLDINAAVAVAVESTVNHPKSSLKHLILMKKPKLFQRATSVDRIKEFFVQGASKLVFLGSSSENDFLRFQIYDGKRRLAHFSKVCYKISLKSFIKAGRSSFVFNEFWAHMHKQMNFLHKFGDAESFGKLQFSLKIGSVYATEIPKMFIETFDISIWLARMALEKAFKSSKSIRTSGRSAERIEISGLKVNPKEDSSIQESVSSNRVTQSLQSLLDSIDETGEKEEMVPVKKNKKLFGKMCTNFESYVSEEVAIKIIESFGGFGAFEREPNFNVSLVCFDEGSSTNCSFSLNYSSETGELIKISRRPLKWANVDVIGGEEDFDFRFSISTRLSSNLKDKTTEIKSSIFCDGILESNRSELKVREAFKANSTIYVQIQENHFKSLQNGFVLNVKKLKEAFGVDPIDGTFAILQEKWEIEVKSEIDEGWENLILTHQKRNEIICEFWSNLGLILRII